VSKDVERETRRFEVCQRNVACRTAVEGRIAIHVLGYNKQLKGYGKENTCGGSKCTRAYMLLSSACKVL
jgi:hypothetical protein